MLYRLTKPVAKIAFQVYFRKLYLSHLENVPKDKPVILATNHPTAFIEPCILACWLPMELSFLARGDLYLENPFIRKLYNWYHLIPVFRVVDAGFSNVRNNYQSFEKALEALWHNRAVMVLAEGNVKHEKRLRPVVKGTARIVFAMLEKYGDRDVQVVPVGVNYTNPDEFRSVVMMDFGPPIAATEYTECYRQNPARAINELTAELARRLRQRVIHIQDPADEALAELLFEISRNNHPASPLPIVEHDDRPLRREIHIAETLNRLTEPDKDALRQRVYQYFDALRQHRVSDFGLMYPQFADSRNSLLAMAGFCPAALGYALNYLPLKAARLLAEYLAPSIEFIASLAGVFGTLFWLIYAAALSVLTGWLTGSWWLVFITWFGLAGLGVFTLFYMDFFEKWRQARRVRALPEEVRRRLLCQRPVFDGVPVTPPQPQ